MRAEQHLEASFRAVLKNMNLPWPDKAVIEPSKDPKHGDLASNLALVSAKAAGMPPRELAAKWPKPCGMRILPWPPLKWLAPAF